MEHIAIDLGSKESQVCVRGNEGTIVEERRLPTRPASLRRYLSERPKGRVIVEAGAEAFWVAELAKEVGHEVRVVPATLAPALGVGQRGLKTDRRDAQVLSQASCRVDLPSVHIRSEESRRLQSRLGMRDALVRSRTLLLNTVHGHLRTIGEHVRKGSSETLVKRVREKLGAASVSLEPVFCAIEALSVSIDALTDELDALAKQHELARRLKTVPGVGTMTALRFIATLDQVERFPNSTTVRSYVGLVPSEHSSGESKKRGSITKAGSPAMRYLLVQAAWAALLSRRRSDPMMVWAREVAKRRGRKVAAVALARKLAGILFAIWRDGSTYHPRLATEQTPNA